MLNYSELAEEPEDASPRGQDSDSSPRGRYSETRVMDTSPRGRSGTASSSASFASQEADNLDEIWQNESIPMRKKCWEIFKLTSIYKTPNGIFHKNKVFYVTRLSLVGSIGLMIFIIGFLF